MVLDPLEQFERITPHCFRHTVDVTHGRRYVNLLQYHIVWVTKYRKPVLTGNIAVETKRHLLDTMKSLQMDCLAMEWRSCPIIYTSSSAANHSCAFLTPSRWLFMAHPELKESLWGGHLWDPSYFVATVSERSAAQI